MGNRRSHARGLRIWIAAIALATLGGGTFARAGDEDLLLARITDLEAKVAEHTAAKSPEELMADSGTALTLYRENAGQAPHRERILKILGGLTKHKEDMVAQKALLHLGETGDREGAKFVRPLLRPCHEVAPNVVLETAILVCRKLPHESLAEPLLGIVDSSKNLLVAAKAIEALGAFGVVKSKREKVFESIVKTVAKSQSGATRGIPGKENLTNPDAGLGNTTNSGPSNRWKALSDVMVTSLNELTGLNEGTAEGWITTYKNCKSKLSTLFVSIDQAMKDAAQEPAK